MSALAQVKQRLGPGPVVAAVHTLPAGSASFTGREAELERVAAAAASGGTVTIFTIDGMAGIGKTALAVQAARQAAPVFPGGQLPEVTRLCGYLPLAISLTGGFLKHHSSWTVPDLADDLASAANRVVAIAAEDVSVAAAFDLSYRELTAAQQRMFRRLGLMPGPDIDAYAAAALNDTDLTTAGQLLDGLYVTHLADEHARGRYRLHDLIREHAVMMAAEDDAAERDAATSRLLDYYAYCAELADEPLARRSHTSQPFTVTTPPAHAPALSTLAQANAWMLAERANLHCAVINAARYGNPAHATAIATSTHGFLRIHGYWDQALDMHGVALGAARAARDQLCEAETLNNIGVIQRLLHDYPAASASLAQALDLYRALGNRLGEANSLSSLSVLQHATGEPAAAAANQQQAVVLYRRHGDRLGEANALLDLGVVRQVTGDYPAADASLHRALTLYRETGGRLGQAHALKYLGSTRKLSGDHEAATASLLQAFELYRELGNQRGQDDVRRYMDNA